MLPPMAAPRKKEWRCHVTFYARDYLIAAIFPRYLTRREGGESGA